MKAPRLRVDSLFSFDYDEKQNPSRWLGLPVLRSLNDNSAFYGYYSLFDSKKTVWECVHHHSQGC